MGLSGRNKKQETERIRLRLCWGESLIDEISFPPGQPPKRWLDFQVQGISTEGIELSAHGEVFSVVFGCGSVPFGQATISAESSAPAKPLRDDFGVDANFLHTCVVVAAVQACAVSAMLLGPAPLDLQGGAGASSETLRRLLSTAASAAVPDARPVVVAVGERSDEAERPQPTRIANRRAPVKKDPRKALSDLLGALEAAAHAGDNGAALRLAAGDMSSLTPAARVAGVEAGGILSPRTMLADGPHSGVLGTGMEFVPTGTRYRPDEDTPKLPEKKARAVIEVEPNDDIEDRVRDEVAKRVRERRATVRYCYETYALQKDPSKTGRIVLEFALRPDGYVEDIVVSSDDPGLTSVSECVAAQSKDWFLGSALVTDKTRLSFPFILQPRS